MKKPVLSLAVLLGLATANAVAATTDLTITGTITPVACTPTLSNGGLVDYGVLSLTELEVGVTTYRLPAKSLNLTIDCSAPATIAVIATDNRRDSSHEYPWQFGLGLYDDRAIGFYTLQWRNSETAVDGGNGYNLLSQDGGSTWTPSSPINLQDAGKVPDFRASFANVDGRSPTAVTHVTATVNVLGYIHNYLTLNDNADLDGSATIEIVYL